MSIFARYLLRLPRSVKQAVERWARKEGISMNQFMATAVAEKLSVLESAQFFEDRAKRADYERFDRIMSCKGGEPPREDDRID